MVQTKFILLFGIVTLIAACSSKESPPAAQPPRTPPEKLAELKKASDDFYRGIYAFESQGEGKCSITGTSSNDCDVRPREFYNDSELEARMKGLREVSDSGKNVIMLWDQTFEPKSSEYEKIQKLTKAADFYANLAQANIFGRDSYAVCMKAFAELSWRANVGVLRAKELDENNRPLISVSLECSNHFGDIRVETLLLDNGEDPNLEGAGGSSAIVSAAVDGRTDIMDLLLERGLNLKSTAVVRALLQANTFSDDMAYASTKWLLTHDVPADSVLEEPASPSKDFFLPDLANMIGNQFNVINGRTALMWAAERGQLKTAELLISYGAVPDRKALDGSSARSIVEDRIKNLGSNDTRTQMQKILSSPSKPKN